MQHVTLALPDELSAALGAPGQDLSRAAFEALALAAYRERRFRLRCSANGVELEYSLEDLERDRETHRQLDL